MKQLARINSSVYLNRLLLSIILLLPFSTPVVVALSQHFNVFVVSAWKEALLLAATPFVLIVLVNNKQIRNSIFNKHITSMIIALLVLYSMWAIFFWDGVETAAGFATGTRFLYAYLLALIAGLVHPELWKRMVKVICCVAVIVACIGIVQALVLPKDVLIHVGYDRPGTNTLGVPPAYHLIAGNENYVRAQSTLRGPNVLGAYLILPLVILVFYFLRKKSVSYLIGLMTCIVGIILSYSRSAYLGAAVSILFLIFTKLPKGKIYRYLNWRYITIVLVGTITLGIFLSNTTIIQTLIFHSAPGEKSLSNEGHVSGITQGWADILKHPLGNGVGSAGPASVVEGTSRISENYFIQIGQEIGWLGGILFLAICVALIRFFFANKNNEIASILLFSFVGLSISALFLHTWADEAVAVTWWIIAGVGTGAILNEKRKRDVQTKEKRSQGS